jgi:hypothetical protein
MYQPWEISANAELFLPKRWTRGRHLRSLLQT